MADSQVVTSRSEPDPTDDREDRSYTVLGTVLLVALVFVVILLFWRSCATAPATLDSANGGGVITDVPGLDQVDGGVAVWLRPGEDIETVLARNGLAGADHTDMGDGTYVISLGERDAEAVVERLRDDDGTFDAGFLFAEDADPSEGSGS